MKMSKSCLCRAGSLKGVTCHHLGWRRFKAREGMEKIYSEKNMGFRSALVEGCWHGEAGGSQTSWRGIL